MTCPPCTHNCREGRDCPARREASDDLVWCAIATVVAALIAATLAWLIDYAPEWVRDAHDADQVRQMYAEDR